MQLQDEPYCVIESNLDLNQQSDSREQETHTNTEKNEIIKQRAKTRESLKRSQDEYENKQRAQTSSKMFTRMKLNYYGHPSNQLRYNQNNDQLTEQSSDFSQNKYSLNSLLQMKISNPKFYENQADPISIQTKSLQNKEIFSTKKSKLKIKNSFDAAERIKSYFKQEAINQNSIIIQTNQNLQLNSQKSVEQMFKNKVIVEKNSQVQIHNPYQNHVINQSSQILKKKQIKIDKEPQTFQEYVQQAKQEQISQQAQKYLIRQQIDVAKQYKLDQVDKDGEKNEMMKKLKFNSSSVIENVKRLQEKRDQLKSAVINSKNSLPSQVSEHVNLVKIHYHKGLLHKRSAFSLSEIDADKLIVDRHPSFSNSNYLQRDQHFNKSFKFQSENDNSLAVDHRKQSIIFNDLDENNCEDQSQQFKQNIFQSPYQIKFMKKERFQKLSKIENKIIILKQDISKLTEQNKVNLQMLKMDQKLKSDQINQEIQKLKNVKQNKQSTQKKSGKFIKSVQKRNELYLKLQNQKLNINQQIENSNQKQVQIHQTHQISEQEDNNKKKLKKSNSYDCLLKNYLGKILNCSIIGKNAKYSARSSSQKSFDINNSKEAKQNFKIQTDQILQKSLEKIKGKRIEIIATLDQKQMEKVLYQTIIKQIGIKLKALFQKTKNIPKIKINESDKTQTEQEQIKFQLEYKKNKEKTINQIIKFLDEEMEQKFTKIQSDILSEAILNGNQEDIDDIIVEIEQFRQRKLKRFQTIQKLKNQQDQKSYQHQIELLKKEKELEQQREIEKQKLEHKKTFVEKWRNITIDKIEKGNKLKSNSSQNISKRNSELIISNISTVRNNFDEQQAYQLQKTNLVKSDNSQSKKNYQQKTNPPINVQDLEYQSNKIINLNQKHQNVDLLREGKNVKHEELKQNVLKIGNFVRQLKQNKSVCYSQSKVLKILEQKQIDQINQNSDQQNLMKQQEELRQMNNPLNFFFKKEIKEEKRQNEQTDKNRKRMIHENHIIFSKSQIQKYQLDPNTSMIASNYINDTLNQLCQMEFDYKDQFNAMKAKMKRDSIKKEQEQKIQESLNKYIEHGFTQEQIRYITKQSYKVVINLVNIWKNANNNKYQSLYNFLCKEKQKVDANSNLFKIKRLLLKNIDKIMDMQNKGDSVAFQYTQKYQKLSQKLFNQKFKSFIINKTKSVFKDQTRNQEKTKDQSINKSRQSQKQSIQSQSSDQQSKNGESSMSSDFGYFDRTFHNKDIIESESDDQEPRFINLERKYQFSEKNVKRKIHSNSQISLQLKNEQTKQIKKSSLFLQLRLFEMKKKIKQEAKKLKIKNDLIINELEKNNEKPINHHDECPHMKWVELYKKQSLNNQVQQILKQNKNIEQVQYDEQLSEHLNEIKQKIPGFMKLDKQVQDFLIMKNQGFQFEQLVQNQNIECKSQVIVDMPFIFTMIKNNQLVLSEYQINKFSNVISKTLSQTQDKQFFIQKLVLHRCGLRDEGFSMILRGLIPQDYLQCIQYSSDELGPLSISQLQKFNDLEKHEKKQKFINQISFTDLKIQDSIKVQLIKMISEFKHLQIIQLSGINMISEKKIFQELLNLFINIEYKKQLKQIDISNAGLKSANISKISEYLPNNYYLTHFNISGNQFESNDNIVTNQTIKKKKKKSINYEHEFCENLAKFIKNNQNLVHLDISSMNLGESILIIKRQGIDCSNSLLSIHLQNNRFDAISSLEFQKMTKQFTNQLQLTKQLLPKSYLFSVYDHEKQDEKQEFKISIVNQAQNQAFKKNQEISTLKNKKIHFKIQQLMQQHLDFKNLFLEQKKDSDKKQTDIDIISQNKMFLVNEQIIRKNNKVLQTEISKNFDQKQNLLRDCNIYTRKVGFLDQFIKKQQDIQNDELKYSNKWMEKEQFSLNSQEFWQSQQNESECFICNKSQQIHLFYHRGKTNDFYEEVTNKETISVLKEYYGLNDSKTCNFGAKSYPIVLGTITNWHPQRMMDAMSFTMLRLVRFILKDQITTFNQKQEKIANLNLIGLQNLIFQNLNDSLIQYNSDSHHTVYNYTIDTLSFYMQGWSCFLFDQIKSEKKKDHTEIFNFPYLFNNKKQMDKNIIKIVGDVWKKLKKKKEMIEKTYYNSSDESEKEEIEQGNLEEIERKSQDLFVLSDIVKPGLHCVLIYDPKIDKFYFRHIVVKARTHEFEHFLNNKMAQNQEIIKQEQENNEHEKMIKLQVFGDFQLDQQIQLRQAFLKDTWPTRFKPYKFIQSAQVIDSMLQLIYPMFNYIKEAFLILSAESGNYPNIDEKFLYSYFLEQQIINSKYISRKEFQTIFIQANIEYEQDILDANPDDLLNRSEFIEILMRIAHFQSEKQNSSNPYLAITIFRKILEDKILKLCKKYKVSYMIQKCHNDLKMCEILQRNQLNLVHLFNKFRVVTNRKQEGKKGQFTLESAVHMLRLSNITPKIISNNLINIIYATSKIIIIDEINQRDEYFQLQFVEFKTFLCRVAIYIYGKPEFLKLIQELDESQLEDDNVKDQNQLIIKQQFIQISFMLERLLINLFDSHNLKIVLCDDHFD